MHVEWGVRQSSECRQSGERARVCCCSCHSGESDVCVRCTRGLVGICLPYAAVQVSCVYRWMRRASVGDECGEVNMYARLSRCSLCTCECCLNSGVAAAAAVVVVVVVFVVPLLLACRRQTVGGTQIKVILPLQGDSS